MLAEGRTDLWDSGKIESDQSVHIAYADKKLASRQRVNWKVFVWNENDTIQHSDPAWFEMGLLKREEWKGKWIGASLRAARAVGFPRPIYGRYSSCPPSNRRGCT
jgi:alpha-L-rhamnosidase